MLYQRFVTQYIITLENTIMMTVNMGTDRTDIAGEAVKES